MVKWIVGGLAAFAAFFTWCICRIGTLSERAQEQQRADYVESEQCFASFCKDVH